VANYLAYFGLSQHPFGQAPDDLAYSPTPHVEQVLQRLLHVITAGQGLGVLIGDIGFGKSTVARRLLASLPEDKFEAVMLVMVHAELPPFWLLRQMGLRFGVEDLSDNEFEMLSQVYERLVEIRQSGRRVVVIIDEAQMLRTNAMMEELRGLLNLEIPKEKLVHFVLVGLQELDQYIQNDPALMQRIAMRCYLKPLSSSETEVFIAHRLQQVGGGAKKIFSSEALAQVQVHSGGVPRLINTLCDNALLEAFFAGEKTVSAAIVDTVAESLRLKKGMY
jgi:general secretion pathway protein A